jgi:ferric enterobactin receptor
MNKFCYSFILTALVSSTAFAQFGGPGGGMGGDGGRNRGGSGGFPGMPGQQQQQQVVVRGTGRIMGFILDSTTNKPVEYATVALFDEKNQPIDGASTDQKGAFTLKDIPDGDFRLEVSFLGYTTFNKKHVIVGKGKRDLKLGNLPLGIDARTLGEVTVRGQAELIENKVDRLVYNAEKDIANKGGDASDVMRKVPMLSVDLDGNVSLRGNQNVKVLINGKPSSIMAGTVADALKQIPADMIKSVEVITSPSAKYDAEGSAGIINVITKKNNLQGLRGSVNLSAGTRSSNIFGSINLKYKKLGIGLNMGGNAMYNPTSGYTDTDRLLPNGLTSKTRQENDGRRNGGFGNAQLNFDYELNAKNNVTLSFRNSYRGFSNNTSQLTYAGLATDNALATLFGNKTNANNTSTNIDINFDYTRKFDKTGRELVFFAQYGNNLGNNDYTRDQYRSTENDIFYKERNDNKPVTREMTYQLDYETPIGDNQKIEIGAKALLRHIESNSLFYYDSLKTNTGYQLSPTRSNLFNYDQSVYASYLSYTLSLPNKWSVKPGVRYEYTAVEATFQNKPKTTLPDYGLFVPSLSISKAFKGSKSLRFSFSRRIQRPSIQFLNPNITQSDPLNIQFGNPYLSPEYTNNFELNFSTFFKTTTINIAAFTSQTNNSIETIRFKGDPTRLQELVLANGITTNGIYINQNALITTFQNIGQQHRTGMNFFGSIRPNSKIMINANINAYYMTLNSPSLGLSNDGFVLDGGGFAQFTLKNNWSLQASAFGRGRQIQLQGSQGGFAFYNLSIQKDFKNKKGNFGIGIDNPFASYFKQVTTITSNTAGNEFTQNNVNYNYNRGIKFKFSYNFGKMTFDDSFFKRKKSINNDDQKQGGDSGQQQTAPAAGGRTGG